ncbi:MAG TPA: alpha/beta fold hydrolase [Gaiellaceae bacterium]|jgi:pimeloyl-ACP methyl ester carboxylesterase|nr:alpha/beta fold hydrolase [Gaiellaceae bacterium]
MARLLAVLAVALVAGTASAAPPPVDDCVPRSERAAAISFRAPDGTRLAGVLLGRGRTGIALGHELNSNLCVWLPFARVLAAKGYRVLAFDHRGHGESERYPRAFFRVDRDFVGAVRTLHSRGSTRFVLMGASMGATAALVAAPRIGGPLRAVVELSGPVAYETIDARPAVKRIAAPVLFAVGSEDTAFVSDTRELAALSSNPDSRLVVRPTSGHGTDLLRDAAFRTLVLAFARQHTR